jgi:hypothetical protein
MQDPIKPGTYTLLGTAGRCSDDRVMEAGLCYSKPRDSYSCSVTSCRSNCASGSVECGIAGCAKDTAACANGIANMVISPALMIAGAMTGGAATTAAKTAKELSSMQKLKDTASAAGKVAGEAAQIASVAAAFGAQIEALMLAAENDLASVTNRDVANKIKAKYPVNSAMYRSIARVWTQTYLSQSNKDLAFALTSIVATAVDPTGILSTVEAFTKPTCGQHEETP